MQVIGTICRLRTGLALLRQQHHTAPAWRSLGAELISAGSRSLQSFPPLHAQFQDSMALKPLLHLTKQALPLPASR